MAGAPCLASDAAERLFDSAQKAALAGDSLKAYLLYSQAARLDPANALYAQRRAGLRNSVLSKPAQLGPDPAIETKESQLRAEGILDTPEIPTAPPPSLAIEPGTRDFDLQGAPGRLFEQVAAAFGIRVLFDGAYQPVLPSLRFRISGVTGREALRALGAATDSFMVPVTENVALVARDTAAKRTELTPVMVLAVPIPQRLSVQEAQEISTAVQQTLEIRRISLDPGRRVVYFRDSAQKAMEAREMFTNLARGRAQVEVEVEFITVGRTSTLSYGLSLPSSSSIVDFGKVLGNVPRTGGGAFYAFGGGATLLGLGIADAAVFATLSKTSADTLLRSQIVTLDGQAGSLHVGDRYPVISGNFTGLTGGVAVAGQTLSPSVQFVDLGVVLKITPVVHDNLEVTLDVDSEFKTLGSHSANGIPEIASRQYQGKVRLQDGQWAVIAGLVSTLDSETPTGIAGLSSIPGIGRLFTHQTHEKDLSETWIVLKPRLVALPPWETVTPPMWTGTETRPLTAF